MNDVISEIDRSDFIIADLTDHNPNVMYELALSHALGKPCITIGDDPPFDLKGFHHIYLKDELNLTPNLRRQLISAFHYVHNLILAEDIPENPITMFYRAPLIGINSTVAVAQTYFSNFVKPIVRQMTALSNERDRHLYDIGFIDRNGDQETVRWYGTDPKTRSKLKLIIIIPNTIRFASLDSINKLRGPEDGKLKTAVISAQQRHFTVLSRFDNHDLQFIDIPTPLNGLRQTIERRMRGLQPREDSAEWQQLEAEEVNRFYYTLNRLIVNEQDDIESHIRLLRFDTKVTRLNRDEASQQLLESGLIWLYDILKM